MLKIGIVAKETLFFRQERAYTWKIVLLIEADILVYSLLICKNCDEPNKKYFA
jgi:hypothetical protein